MSKSNMGMTARIVRIEDEFLRITLWAMWFPCVMLNYSCFFIYHNWRKKETFMDKVLNWEANLGFVFRLGMDGIKDKKKP